MCSFPGYSLCSVKLFISMATSYFLKHFCKSLNYILTKIYSVNINFISLFVVFYMTITNLADFHLYCMLRTTCLYLILINFFYCLYFDCQYGCASQFYCSGNAHIWQASKNRNVYIFWVPCTFYISELKFLV